MHDIRIIALDLDGTLLNENKELPERNLRALEAAAAKGIHIVPTTGRYYGGMPQAVRELPFVRYAITVNGAQAVDTHTGEVLYRAEIPWQRAVALMAYFDTLPVAYDCFLDNDAFITADLQNRIAEYTDHPQYQKLVRELRRPVPELKAFVAERQQDVQKTQIFTMDMDLRARMLRELPEMFEDVVTSSALLHNVEINDRRGNKGDALLALAAHLGCTAEQIMACGDGLNDLSMIEAAGLGVAMGNAEEALKACADYITADCDHAGVAAVIEKFCL